MSNVVPFEKSEDPQGEPTEAAAYAELSKDPRVVRDPNRLNRLKEIGQVGKPRPSLL